MHSFKKIIKTVIVVVLAAAILLGLDFLLYPCTFMRNDIHTVTTEEHHDIFLGTSHGMTNIDPDTVESVTGKKGHNLCVGGEYGIDAYYLTKLLIEKQKPKRIIYEVDPGYFITEKEPGNNYLLFYHEFPMSMAKVEYFLAAQPECDFRTVLFPWYEYSLKYEFQNMKKTVYQKWNHNYDVSYLKGKAQEYHESGFIERYPVAPEEMDRSVTRIFTKEGVKAQNMEYLGKMIELCKEEGIELIALTTPIPDAALSRYEENYNAAWDYFSAFFAERGVRYMNFNREYYDLFSHDLSGYTDYDGHMHGEAAVRFSNILGILLKDYE